MTDAEAEFAAQLFEETFGQPPPSPYRWTLIAHEQDGTQPLFRVQGRTVHLYPHAGQMQAWQSAARFVFMIAGTQGGKTSFTPWLLARDILADRDGGDWLAVSATFDLFKLKLLPAMREVFEGALGIGRYWAGDQVLELRDPESGAFWAQRASDPMWGRIILRSAVAKGGLESATAKAALLDEAGQDDFSLMAWEAVRRRLSLTGGRVYAGTTPYNLGWLKREVFDRWERGDDEIDVVQFASNINPAFSQDEYDRARERLPGWRFRMFYGGLFERPAGQIYHDFLDTDKSEGGHLARRFLIPLDWPRYQGVDPGIIHTAKLWAAHDAEEDVYYLYREQMGPRKPAEQHAADDLDLERANGERVVQRAIGAKSEIYWRQDYRTAGADGVLEPTVHDVEQGIERVILLWRQHRLYVFDDLHGLLDEILRYSRKLDAQGNVTRDIKDKSAFHLVDTLRYLAILLTDKTGSRKSYSKSYIGDQ